MDCYDDDDDDVNGALRCDKHERFEVTLYTREQRIDAR